MSSLSRRKFVAGSATVGAASLVAQPQEAAAGAAAGGAPRSGPAVVTKDDPRYPTLVWGSNQRWVGTPDAVHVVTSTAQVVASVQEAVRTGKRVAVRSGGHCYENFVGDPAVRLVIDLSRLNAVYHDRQRGAFAVEPGATLGDAYRGLDKQWGVTLPGSACPTVGIGGHVVGGGVGQLSRWHGATVDHLYAVEVVVVDANGTARAVVATRDAGDPNRDLWWAHTGGGGGNFGVVTKYWFRSPGATRAQPAQLLPKAPSEMLVSTVAWGWPELNETSFGRIMKNYGAFYERNSAPGTPYARMFAYLNLIHKASGVCTMVTQIDARLPDAERLLDEYLAAVHEGVGTSLRVLDRRRLPWLHSATQWPGYSAPDNTTRFKGKSAFHRKNFSDRHAATFYKHLTRDDYGHPGAIVQVMAHGGQINTVPSPATALAHRDSILKLNYLNFWTDPAEDAKHLGWMREFYRDVYAGTGGVPVPNDETDGCFINYADVDVADPKWNTSQTPWSQLYYKDNYPKLQQVKARWDPRDVFKHTLSVRPPGR
ncbi:FAD-binding oxidoreductase [Actinomadura yumaensis]|uniref:FAD-binding oxidoreductase n=2 Tax=Actinomadura yumaensis TaxID=111807 RepID=A0ABW2CYZ0_9ACTN